jgi:hypothetical protein
MFMQPRNAWVRWSKGRLTYRGRITRQPFEAWVQTPEGCMVLASAAARVRFALFGKRNVARRRLWQALAAAAREPSVASAIQQEIDVYFERMGDLAYGEGLPRTTIELDRLIVLPCVVINAATYQSIEKRLNALPAIASLDAGGGLGEFFFLELVNQIEAATRRVAPSPKRPLPAGASWILVGISPELVWRARSHAPQWSGHHYVFEVPRAPITRATRKAVIEKIHSFESSLPSLSYFERSNILKRAVRSVIDNPLQALLT